MTSAGEPVSLSANDIHLSFGPNAVLRGVDIDVPAGTTAAVIGPSGSGKSTLLRTLNRLYEPDRGDILLDGRSVLADNPDQLRQRIGMVFQQFNLFPHRSVLDNVTLAPRKLKRLGAEQARELGIGATGPGRAAAQGRRAAVDLVGRPAAAGGDRAGTGDVPAGDVLRRGHFGAGPRTGEGHPGAHRRPRRRRHDDGRRHPRNGLRPVGRGRRGVHGPRQGRRVGAARAGLRSRRDGPAASASFRKYSEAFTRSSHNLAGSDRLDCRNYGGDRTAGR